MAESTDGTDRAEGAESISWETARQANRLNWEDRVPIHRAAYGLEDFDDPAYISNIIRDDLPVLEPFLPGRSLQGLTVCHLQCHLGTDSISLARLGASVVGVDFSPAALAVARQLAARHQDDARFVESDVLEAASVLTEQFDLVYTSIGTIVWLGDLGRWAEQIAALLKTGGVFYIRDGHPMMLTLDETSPDLAFRYPYFNSGSPLADDASGTYTGTGTVAHTRTYEYAHPLSEVVSALLNAGLSLELLREDRALPWQQFGSAMVWSDEADGFIWRKAARRDMVPLTFTIAARKR